MSGETEEDPFLEEITIKIDEEGLPKGKSAFYLHPPTGFENYIAATKTCKLSLQCSTLYGFILIVPLTTI